MIAGTVGHEVKTALGLGLDSSPLGGKEMFVACRSTVELKDLRLKTQIGTDGPADSGPESHILDMTLWIDASLVLIAEDGMSHVFDYDPLVAEIDRLANDGHYATQERLLTRILAACAAHAQVDGVELFLRKTPVQAASGSLGVRILVDAATLDGLRQTTAGLGLPAHTGGEKPVIR